MIDKNVLNKLILEGKTVKECSLLLGVSPTTIKRYRKEYGLSNNIILRKYKCERCENIVEISSIKEKDKVYCSRSCANTRTHSKDTKDKIKYTLRSKNIRVNKYCIGCNFDITDRKKKNKFCSISCSSKYYANTPEGKAHFQKIGKISASNTVKRSKNEILFFEKCSDYFKNVENNIPIFNGWDADIIIHDIKVAILWNGKWHYEYIRGNQSLSQIQNRDRIKISEIVKYGYEPYIIKDMGRYSKFKVDSEFDIFINYINKN